LADTVLVTGISGFIAGHVARLLLDAGYHVRGSLRTLARADEVRRALGAATASGITERLEFVELDLTDDRGWREAAKGCRYVQHVASPFFIEIPENRDELIVPAVEGTRRALTAALEADVERVVLTSSVAAVAYGHPPERTEPFTAADWSKTEGGDVTAYTESKTRAELEAWTVMESAGRRQDLAVINPHVVLGPLLGDDPGVSAALVKRLIDGSLPFAARVNIGIVDVRDVAELHLNAMETSDAGGKRFLASAGNLSLMEGADVLRPAFPQYARKLPWLELPDWFVRAFGWIDKDMRSNMSALGVKRAIDNGPAIELLGRPLLTPQIALLATAHSLIQRGLV
jgi:nucleoside-diphosphate-sugar epimerase